MGILKNKIVIITGGSGLLGKEFCSDVHNEGGVPINLDIEVSKSDKNNIKTDITSKKSIDKSIEKIISNYGEIHGLVNNAYPRTKDFGSKFEEMPIESWQKNFDFQLISHIYMTKKIIDVMKNQNFGSIVNIGSIYGALGYNHGIYNNTTVNPSGAYSVIKGGIINFTRYLASAYGPYGIRSNCVSPGGVFDNHEKRFEKNYASNTPLGRMAEPKDIASVVSFILSEKAAYVTGQNVIVDGGWSCK